MRPTQILFSAGFMLYFILRTSAVQSQILPEGSLIIPMDNRMSIVSGGQAEVLKAYGLVYALLSNGVPVRWAYSNTKWHDGVDFSALPQQVKLRYGDQTITTKIDYSGSAFIIGVGDTAAAGPIIRSFAGNTVTVHQVLLSFSNAANIPFRETLRTIPRAFIQDHQANYLSLVTSVLTLAGIPPAAYTVDSTGIPVMAVLSGQGSNCYTIVMIPHDDALSPSDIAALKNFANDGGTVYLQCMSVLRFETLSPGAGYVLTTGGLDPQNDPTNRINWKHPDTGARTSIGQFVGLSENSGGSVPAWDLYGSSSYRPYAISIIRMSSDSLRHKAMMIRKDNDTSKGIFVFAGGHGYVGNNVVLVNLARVLLNTFFTPVRRRNCTPLPVEFASFTAVNAGDDALLSWRTSSESNNAGFEIERRHDEDDAWTRIGFVPGSGTSVHDNDYAYLDAGAGRILSSATYRLRQIDHDGSSAYSHEQHVFFHEVPRVAPFVTLLPNPASDAVEVAFFLRGPARVSISVHDALGRRRIDAVSGRDFPAGRQTVRIPTTSLDTGAYSVTLHDDSFITSSILRIVR